MLVYIGGKALHTYNTHTHTDTHSMDSYAKMTVHTYIHTHTHTYILQSYSKLALRNKIIDNFEDFILLLFSLRICPALENILTQGTEEATTQSLIFTTV
jgi:hypothetical protein